MINRAQICLCLFCCSLQIHIHNRNIRKHKNHRKSKKSLIMCIVQRCNMPTSKLLDILNFEHEKNVLYVVYASVDTMPLEFLNIYLFARRYPEQPPPWAIYHIHLAFVRFLFFFLFFLILCTPKVHAHFLFFRKKIRINSRWTRYNEKGNQSTSQIAYS